MVARPEDRAMDWNLLFGFDGRINRAKCWCVTLINSVCTVVLLLFVPLNIGNPFRNADPHWGIPLTMALLIGTLGPILFISTWCFAAVGCKRLHDRNKSGWCMVPFFVLPMLLAKAAQWPDAPVVDALFLIIASGINLWAFVEIFCLKGTKGPNAFGPDPVARTRKRLNTASGAPA
jgi:uncharacterized membrane protein YhaH (DUF805 family)